MTKLRKNKDIIDFNQLDESKYLSLVSCDMLKFSYPFCKGRNFNEDLETFNALSIIEKTIETIKAQQEGLFTPFWFEGNFWFKMVNNYNDLSDLLELHVFTVNTSVKNILNCKECVRDRDLPPKFGFASECKGERNLKQFLGLTQ